MTGVEVADFECYGEEFDGRTGLDGLEVIVKTAGS